MGRELKRVPLDFDYPLRKVWYGYAPSLEDFKNNKEITKIVPEIKIYKNSICESCDKLFNNCSENARYCVWYNEDIKSLWFKEVPSGEGYQLWETTSEGSPQSPVFKTLEELCEWCEGNATTFAHFKTTKEEWFKMLNEDNVCYKEGNVVFF